MYFRIQCLAWFRQRMPGHTSVWTPLDKFRDSLREGGLPGSSGHHSTSPFLTVRCTVSGSPEEYRFDSVGDDFRIMFLYSPELVVLDIRTLRS